MTLGIMATAESYAKRGIISREMTPCEQEVFKKGKMASSTLREENSLCRSLYVNRFNGRNGRKYEIFISQRHVK